MLNIAHLYISYIIYIRRNFQTLTTITDFPPTLTLQSTTRAFGAIWEASRHIRIHAAYVTWLKSGHI